MNPDDENIQDPSKDGTLTQPPSLLYEEQEKDTPRTRSKLFWVIGLLITVLVLGLGLGVGLGIGLNRSSNGSGSSNDQSSSSSSPSSIPSGIPISPGNSSDITISLSRQEILGDTNRWLMSSRDFRISSSPTTRVFNWTISEAFAPPGGMEKPMILINGLSPGPIVEANLGDRLIFNVFNNMTNETTLHWHGQYLQGENYMDGTYSFTQCGHTPGTMLTYNWTVQNVGTSWYHAHRGTQYTDGMYGPLIFHSPNETAMISHNYQDDYTFMINDMYNTQGSALDWRFKALGTGLTGNPGDEPVPDGGMINGISQASCAYIPSSNSVLPERRKRGLIEPRSSTGGTAYPETNYCGNLTTDYWNLTLVRGSTYRIRLINSGTFLDTQFSIDNHTLTIIEADGISVEPLNVSSVDLGVAQRYSVLVTLDQEPGAYWIRNTLDVTQQARYYGPNYSGTTLGVLRYDGINATIMPATNDSTSAPDIPGLNTLDTSKLVPADKMDAELPDWSTVVQYGMQYTSDNQHYMFFNQSSWSPLPPGQSAFGIIQNLSNSISSFTNNQTALQQLGTGGMIGNQLSIVNPQVGTAELIINSLDDGAHPFHLHGHTFQILSLGDRFFSGDTASLNRTNPMRRDTVVIPAYGHLVIRYSTNSPGIWVFHCHISWHMEIGLLLSVTNLPDQIAKMGVPKDMMDMCKIDSALGFR